MLFTSRGWLLRSIRGERLGFDCFFGMILDFFFSVDDFGVLCRSAVGSDDEWPSKYSKVFIEVCLI